MSFHGIILSSVVLAVLVQPLVVRELTFSGSSVDSTREPDKGVRGRSTRLPAPALAINFSIANPVSQTWEHFAYEVVISNIGSETIILPTFADRAVIVNTPSPLKDRQLGISIIIDAPGGKRAGVYGLELYGSPTSPGTLQSIRPGEAIKIQAVGVWALQEEFSRNFLNSAGRDFAVRAEMSLGSGNNEWTSAVSSLPTTVNLRLPE